jgi:hypothetical protein
LTLNKGYRRFQLSNPAWINSGPNILCNLFVSENGSSDQSDCGRAFTEKAVIEKLNEMVDLSIVSQLLIAGLCRQLYTPVNGPLRLSY